MSDRSRSSSSGSRRKSRSRSRSKSADSRKSDKMDDGPPKRAAASA